MAIFWLYSRQFKVNGIPTDILHDTGAVLLFIYRKLAS